jgi:hypothetical protein
MSRYLNRRELLKYPVALSKASNGSNFVLTDNFNIGTQKPLGQ